MNSEEKRRAEEAEAITRRENRVRSKASRAWWRRGVAGSSHGAKGLKQK